MKLGISKSRTHGDSTRYCGRGNVSDSGFISSRTHIAEYYYRILTHILIDCDSFTPYYGRRGRNSSPRVRVENKFSRHTGRHRERLGVDKNNFSGRYRLDYGYNKAVSRSALEVLEREWYTNYRGSRHFLGGYKGHICSDI